MATLKSNAENAAMRQHALSALRKRVLTDPDGRPCFFGVNELLIEMGRKWPAIKAERIANQVASAERIVIVEWKRQHGEIE